MYSLENYVPNYEAKFASTHSLYSYSITEKEVRARNTSIETSHVSSVLNLDLVDPGSISPIPSAVGGQNSNMAH